MKKVVFCLKSMKRTIAVAMSVILAATVLSACGNNGGQSVETVDTTTAAKTGLQEKAKSIFEQSFRDYGFMGAGYMVYKGEEIYSGGVGKANKKEDTDNGADVVYHVASITKQFTAAAILKLCEEKKLTLDDTLSKYFAGYKAGADITIHNLLSMQSGIPDFTREYDENGDEKKSDSQVFVDGVERNNSVQENRSAVRKWIFSQKLLFKQGGRYSYSNSNYFLLGEIIEQVSKKTYFDYIKTSFFEPLELTTAGFDENYDNSSAQVAKGHNNTGLVTNLYGYPGVSFGSGDLMISPKELYKWSAALHGGKVLSEESVKKMTEKYADCGDGTSYGYGLMIADSPAGTLYMHSGAVPKFFSYYFYLPQKELFVSLMSNYASETIFTVTKEIGSKILKEFN